MPTWIERILRQLQSETLKLLLLAGGLLLLWGTFAPIGTLVWWLTQSTESLGLEKERPEALLRRQASETKASKINCYVIFLPGVGDFSGDQLTPGEELFFHRLIQRHPQCVAVRDVFPYSVRSNGLGGERVLAPLWQIAREVEGADILIQIRNLWRFAISADDRYGPIYNRGIAMTIVNRMNAAHPIPASRDRLNLIFISTSGGTQVALGAVSYLEEWLNARLVVVSVGGTFDGKAGFETVNHVYHLQGDRDWVEQMTGILFPSRWFLTVGSPFNEARRQGRYTVCDSGPHQHSSSEGYFGLAPINGSKTTYVEKTLEQVDQLPIWSLKQPTRNQCRS